MCKQFPHVDQMVKNNFRETLAGAVGHLTRALEDYSTQMVSQLEDVARRGIEQSQRKTPSGFSGRG
jgi:hypothetical protein